MSDWYLGTQPGAPFETPLAAADQGYAETKTNPGLGADLGAEFGEGVTEWLARAAGHAAYAGATPLEQGIAGAAAAALDAQVPGLGMLPPEPAPAPLLATEDANQRFGPIGPDGKQVAITNHPVSEPLARLMGQEKSDALQREGVIARYDANHSALTDFAVGAVGQMLDPLNAALMFVPPLGEGALLGRLAEAGIGGFAGRTLARAGAGAIAGAAIQLPEAGIKLALAPEEATDYGIADALREVAFGAVGFGALHALGGAARDLLGRARGAGGTATGTAEIKTDAATNRDAMATAVAQTVEGRPVDVAPIVTPAAAPEKTVADLAASQRRLYDDGFAPGMAPDEFAATDEAVYGAGAAEPKSPPGSPGEAASAPVAPERPDTAPAAETAPPAPSLGAAEATEAATEMPARRRGASVGPRVARPPDIVQFLASHGGLEPSGDLAVMDAHKKFVPGAGMLVRKSGAGLDHDRARELAQEAGYLPPDNPRAPSQSTVSDLYDAIDQTLRGNPRYSDNDATQLLDYRDYQRRLAERHGDEEAQEAIESAAHERGVTLSPDETASVHERIAFGDPVDAAIDNVLERDGMQMEGDQVAAGAEPEEDIPYDDIGAHEPGRGLAEPGTGLAAAPGGEAGEGRGGPGTAAADAGREPAPRQEFAGDTRLEEPAGGGPGGGPRPVGPRPAQDPELAQAERNLAASPVAMLGEADRAELARTDAALRRADDDAGGAEAAGQCLKGTLL